MSSNKKVSLNLHLDSVTDTPKSFYEDVNIVFDKNSSSKWYED